MNQPQKSVGAVFDAVLELPLEQRGAYLERACAGDEVLRQRVELLLRAHDAAGTFMEGPAADRLPPTVALTLPPTEKPGDRIGRYKLLQQIGEGGCGVVYMAEQEEPVKRRVALKVIKLGMDTKSVIARFEAERQALALMDHPNIAKVLDAGATDTGRPYFVMELVRGIKITDYCDQHNLPTQARLDLFVQICRAVQHAHQKGIIHRDIKPSNILVTHNDGVPMPKVIDFGIAKATQGKLTDQTLFTAFEQFIGTPAYMSPEQAEMSALDIDTRSDIYSLGVLLYELLTGKTPFDAKELLQAGLDEMRRQIREKEPAKPSTRLSTMMEADLTSVAAHRQAQAPKLIHLVRGDLDWIVMKCLEKDRMRRYDTANGLAMDVQRFLEDEPVLAAAPTTSYKLLKWMRRHRMFVIAAGLVLLSLVAGIIGTTWGLLEALRQKRQAERQGKIASHTTDFLTEMFTSIDPQQAKLRDITVREILDKAGGQIGTAFPNDPMAELPIQRSMIWTYDKLGRYEEALNHAQAAYRLALAIHGNADSHDTAESLGEVALYQRQLARLNDAIPNATAALAMWQRLYPGVHTNVVKGFLLLGGCLYESGRSAEAASKFQEALVMLQRIYTGDHIALAVTRGNVAKCLAESGQAQAALPQFEAVLAMYQRLFKGDNPAVALGFANVASCLQKLGRYPEALTNHQQALAMERRIYKADHPSVASDMGNLASCLQALGRLDEALALNQEMLAMNRRIYKGDHPQTAKALHLLAYTDEAMGHWPEALQLHQEALAMWTRVYPSDHPETAWEMGDVGRCLQYLGLYPNALTNLEAALAMEQRLFKGDHPDLARAMGDVAYCMEFLSRSTEALPQHEAALAMRRRIYRSDHPDVVESLSHLGICLQHLGRFEEAVSNHEAAVQMSERIYRGDNVAVAQRRNELAVCLQSMGLWTGFLTNEQANLVMLQRIFVGDHSSVGTVLIAVGDGLNLVNRPEEARLKFQDAAAMLQRLAGSQPSNNIVGCALAKSHLRLGNLDSEMGNVEQAGGHYRTGLEAAESVLSVDADHAEARQIRLALRAKLGSEHYEAVVTKILPGGQAERIGLQKGDVLTRYGGRAIITADDLLLLIARAEGTQIKAACVHGGAPLDLTFKPGPLGASFEDRVIN